MCIMGETGKLSRRQFVQSAAVASAVSGAPAVWAKQNPGKVIGVASIGVGTKGYRNLVAAQDVPNTEIRVICDLYDGNIERAKKLCTNPNVRVIKEWERVLEQPDIDAVIISTPDFWHAPMTIKAAEAGKDIYVEKGWCVTLQEAKDMRRAVKTNNVVMQLGHHYNSSATYHRAREIFRSGVLGKVPMVRTFIDRTGTVPQWIFYTDYNISKAPEDAGPSTIDWDRFLDNAPKRDFDINRFFTWRRFWDYGTGLAGDLMSHLWDGVNMVMGMGIPETMVTQGGIYFWQDDREVPDMWHTIMDYPKQDLAISFGACTHSVHVGEMTHILGREKTLEVSPQFCRVYDGEWKPEARQKKAKAQDMASQLGLQRQDAVIPPDYSMDRNSDIEPTSHMHNFLDCVRTRALPRCGVDRAFEEAATIVMSIEAFKRNAKVRWDAEREEIVNAG